MPSARIFVVSLAALLCASGAWAAIHSAPSSSSSSSTATPLPRLPLSDFVGTGYNIFVADPTRQDDQGLRGVNVFDLDWSATSMDGDFSVPRGVDGGTEVTCNLDAETTVIRSTHDLSTHFAAGLYIHHSHHGFLGFDSSSFTLSEHFNAATEQFSAGNVTQFHTDARCDVYTAAANADDVPSLAPALLAGVQQMESALHESTSAFQQVAKSFLDTFGTHYVSSVRGGARYRHLASMHSSEVFDLQQTDLNVYVASSGSSWWGISSHYSSRLTNEQVQHIERFRASCFTMSNHSVGPPPPADGNWSSWLSAARAAPSHSAYAVEPIASLITNTRFPHLRLEADATTPSVAALLDAFARGEYCATLNGNASCPLPTGTTAAATVAQSGTGAVRATCPVGTKATAAGLEPLTQTSRTTAVSVTCEGEECSATTALPARLTALCLAVSTRHVTGERTHAASTLKCPAGTVVASCGHEPDAGSAADTNPTFYPINDTHCGFNLVQQNVGYVPRAVCVERASLSAYTYTELYVTGTQTVTCPAGTTVLGCGAQAVQGSDANWFITPDATRNGCSVSVPGANVFVTCGGVNAAPWDVFPPVSPFA